MTARLALPALLLLAACSDKAPEPAGAMTSSEAKALNDAAEMIDQRRLPPGTLESDDKGAGEAPARADAAE